jgi:AAA domain
LDCRRQYAIESQDQPVPIGCRGLASLLKLIERLWHQVARELSRPVVEIEVISCDEAGYDGFWLHHLLEAHGVRNQCGITPVGRALRSASCWQLVSREDSDMTSNKSLKSRLRRVYWIGGGSGAGKSTIAKRLASKYNLRLYSTDETMREHQRNARSAAPIKDRFGGH